MGQLDVHIRHGGGGGPDLGGLIAPAVVAGVVAGVALIIQALMWPIIGTGVAVLVAWFATRGRRAARRAEIAAQWAAARRAVEDEDRRWKLELARARAPQVHIDGAVIAGALAAVVQQYQQAQPAQVLRGEVER